MPLYVAVNSGQNLLSLPKALDVLFNLLKHRNSLLTISEPYPRAVPPLEHLPLLLCDAVFFHFIHCHDIG